MNCCIHYIACDSIKYCLEAEASACNFRKNCTSDIVLYTDCNFKSKVFDKIIKIQNLIPKGYIDEKLLEGKLYFNNKIKILMDTDYEYNLYLDGDIKTFVNIDCIFEMLDKFYIIVAHDSCRSSDPSDKLNIPICFPDMNCGLIFYKKSKTIDFFQNWLDNYNKYPEPNDQPSFRKTLWDSTIRFHILPEEFNHRPKKFHFKQKLSIIHGRGEGFLPEINKYKFI
jgi:hypothetical protein